MALLHGVLTQGEYGTGSFCYTAPPPMAIAVLLPLLPRSPSLFVVIQVQFGVIFTVAIDCDAMRSPNHPLLFMSRDSVPSIADFTWRSAAAGHGVNQIVILPSDPSYADGVHYTVGIHLPKGYQLENPGKPYVTYTFRPHAALGEIPGYNAMDAMRAYRLEGYLQKMETLGMGEEELKAAEEEEARQAAAEKAEKEVAEEQELRAAEAVGAEDDEAKLQSNEEEAGPDTVAEGQKDSDDDETDVSETRSVGEEEGSQQAEGAGAVASREGSDDEKTEEGDSEEDNNAGGTFGLNFSASVPLHLDALRDPQDEIWENELESQRTASTAAAEGLSERSSSSAPGKPRKLPQVTDRRRSSLLRHLERRLLPLEQQRTEQQQKLRHRLVSLNKSLRHGSRPVDYGLDVVGPTMATIPALSSLDRPIRLRSMLAAQHTAKIQESLRRNPATTASAALLQRADSPDILRPKKGSKHHQSLPILPGVRSLKELNEPKPKKKRRRRKKRLPQQSDLTKSLVALTTQATKKVK